jgi:DUF438 domain-containing protein
MNVEEDKQQLKTLLKSLTKETRPEEAERLKSSFKSVLEKATPMTIVQAESELVREGMTTQDIMTACDIHLQVLKDGMNTADVTAPEGHPITRFQSEHVWISGLLEKVRDSVKRLKTAGSAEAGATEILFLRSAAEKLLEAESHNVRQENTLFPVLEKHGVLDPPAIMWSEHLEMKKDKKRFRDTLARNDLPFGELVPQLEMLSLRMLEQFLLHSRKEQQILYSVAMQVITPEEWDVITEECETLGFFSLSENT